MSGTINFALTQQFDMDGRPLSGGLLYFFAAGTTTPQSAFQEIALLTPYPNPIVLDASGRVPMFYLADGNIKIRLATAGGVTVVAADNLLVIGPSSGGGGGGGGGGDPTTLLQTGDIKSRYGTGPLDGFVRCNGLSIGKTGSGATERADSVACRALFEYLWPFPNITLDTAKGATATADFDAGRLLNLPDLRGRFLAGMDDMGATAAGRLTTTGLGVSGTVLGNVGAAQTIAITINEMPAHAHTQQGTFSGSGSGTFSGTLSTTINGSTGAGTVAASVNGTASGTITSGTATGPVSLSTGGVSVFHTHTWGGGFTTAGANSSLDHTHNYQDLGFAASNNTASGGNPPGGSQNDQTRTSAGANSGLDHTHNVTVSGTTSVDNVDHFHTASGTISLPMAGAAVSVNITLPVSVTVAIPVNTPISTSGSVSVSTALDGLTTSSGNGAAFSKVPPTMVLTFYIKL